jgi:hypothetical protein
VALPVVQALQALRGVQFLVAITVVAELGDLTRFDSPRQLAAFVGLVPSEYSTGRRVGSGPSPRPARPRAPRLDRKRVGVSPSGEGLGAYPAPHRHTPETDSGHRLEGASAVVQALSSAGRARQTSERSGHSDRA